MKKIKWSICIMTLLVWVNSVAVCAQKPTRDEIIWTEEDLTCSTMVTYKDVNADDETLQKALSVLYALGIMQGDEEGNFRPKDTLTRAECAKILTRLNNMESEKLGNYLEAGLLFEDVTPEHWAVKEIGFVKITGDMGGDFTDYAYTFRPEEAITKDEWITVLVRSLCNWYAKEKEFLVGYYKLDAQFFQLTSVVEGYETMETPTREVCALMLYRALTLPMVVEGDYGQHDPYDWRHYSVADGINAPLRTMLSFYFDIERSPNVQ